MNVNISKEELEELIKDYAQEKAKDAVRAKYNHGRIVRIDYGDMEIKFTTIGSVNVKCKITQNEADCG